MNKWQQDVLDFQVKLKNYRQEKVAFPPEDVINFRKDLIHEEVFEELFHALDTKDMEKIADGIADGIYVLLGTAIAFGIDLAPIWEEVHKTNMQKEPSDDSVKKVKKPEGWQPPDIAGLLKAQGWIK
jgi:predicted HAD superfamily Cof-like phosphohydrolase